MRNEEHNVTACLDALLAERAVHAIRVIDDGSHDRTASLVAARATSEPRLTLLAAGELPEGWRGKVHAMEQGARGVSSPWLLLLDADARHRPEAAARALAAARAHQLDVLSLAGLQETRGIAENLLVPSVFALLDAQLGDWRKAARGGGRAVANGQFLLLRRSAWEECGGFAAVKGETSDDVEIARVMRRHGFRTGFFRAPHLLRIRMYQGFREAVQGWRRNLGAVLGPRPETAAATVAALCLPGALLLFALLLRQWSAAAELWAGGVLASALLRGSGGYPVAYGLLFPCDTLVLALVLARAVLDYRGGRLTSWKGREIRLG